MRLTRQGAILAAALAASLPAQAGQNSDRPAPPDAKAGACLPPDAAPAAAVAPASPPVLVDGFGYAGIEPDTNNAEAKRWFEQGVRLIWAYDEIEAVRAFEQAQNLDPNCALCFWGEAWARGPTLNLQPRTEEHGKASLAIRKAASLSAKLGARDKALIAAMQLRVAPRGKFDNKRYAAAMAKLARQFPGEDAVLVMAADAKIILATRRGLKEGSDAQAWLETVVKRNPAHSGAIHLYIHLTDFIDRQALAVPYADRLGRLAPAASHLVHMPSHSFYGVGRYADDRAYVERVKPPASAYRTGLYAHNSHFAIESALMRGDGKTALEIADHYRQRYDPAQDKGFRAVIRAATWYAYGLHRDIDRVLAMPAPPKDRVLMRTMRHYARGEALARKADGAAVRAEAAEIAKLLAGPESRSLGSRQAEALVEITQRVLEGRAAMIDRDYQAAAAAFRIAMTLQEGADFGSDPPPFWYPVRRSLGAALLAAGDHAGARAQLTASLAEWPNDPLALFALARAEQALGARDPAAEALRRAKDGWSGDVEAVPLSRI
jgi:hypothetical protein